MTNHVPGDNIPQHSTSPDWDQIRKDFPILDQEIEGRRLSYLDSAASSQIPRQTIEAMVEHQTKYHANVHRGVHTLSQCSTDTLNATRSKMAAYIGANEPAECIFVRGATEGINLVAHCISHDLKSTDNIVLTVMEHHSNIVPWYILQQRIGFEIRVVPILNDSLSINPDDVAQQIDQNTKLIGCIHVSNALGTINDVKSIISAAKAVNPNILALVDGCQASLHLPLNLQDLQADFYTLSAHKMCGPTGIGILWGKREHLERLPPFMGGGDMILSVAWDHVRFNEIPHKFEAGTPPILAIVGLGATLDYLKDLRPYIHAREQTLGHYFLKQLSNVKGLTILGPTDFNHRVSTFSMVFQGVHPHDVGTIFNEHGVAIRAGHHCTQPLLKSLGLSATARASITFYNNTADIDQALQAALAVQEIFG